MRNLIWLTPVAPSGAPVTGAGTPVQVPPPLSVRAIEVQYWVAQWPGVLAWPITQPVCVPMNVTEVGRKLAGTGAGRPADGDGRGAVADDSVLAVARSAWRRTECPACRGRTWSSGSAPAG